MIPPLAAARPFSVVVIGGGLAGLSAVQTLVRESSQHQQRQRQQEQPEGILPVVPPPPPPMHITLLEAKDRLGGRVHTISLATAAAAVTTDYDADADAPHVADMGGMYFHGQGSVLKSLQEAFPEWKTTGSGGDSAVPGGQEALYKVYTNNDTNNIKNESRDSGMVPLLTARDLTRQEQQDMSKVYHEWTKHMEQRLQEFQKDNNNNKNNSVNDVSHHPALLSKWSQEFCARLALAQQQDEIGSDSNDELLRRLPLLQQRGLEFYQRLHFDLDFSIAWPDVAMQGWTNDWDFCDLPGDDIISVQGMRQLIHAMEIQLLDNTNNSDDDGDTPTLTIRKKTRVERIEYDLDDTPASTSSTSLTTAAKQSPCCRIITSDQGIFEADACICTIPLGVLKKRARQLFVPPLPNDKLQALGRAGVGTLNTLVVEWSKPIHCYCTNKDEQAVASAYYLMGADDKTTTSNPLWHGFVCPAMLRNQEEDATITQFHFYETANIPFDDLDFWKQQALQVVQAVVGSSSSGSADNQPRLCLEDIVNVHISAWHLDPDFMGSYSAPTTTTRGNEDRKILAEPVLGRSSSGGGCGLYFAGEHTHYKGRFATMDGAYETGIRAARQVLQQQQQQQQQRKASGNA